MNSVLATIVKITENGRTKYRVYSKSGKNLGTYLSKQAAEKRLLQVEMFKHMKKS